MRVFLLKWAMINSWFFHKGCSSSYANGLAWWDDPLWGKQPTQFLIVILGLTQLGPRPLCMPFSRILATSRSPRRYHPSIGNSTILDWWRLVTFGDMQSFLICIYILYIYSMIWLCKAPWLVTSWFTLLPLQVLNVFELYCSHLAIGNPSPFPKVRPSRSSPLVIVGNDGLCRDIMKLYGDLWVSEIPFVHICLASELVSVLPK